MCVVHYCGSKSILPFQTKISEEIIKNGLRFEDQSISALALKKLICTHTNVPMDHLKLYSGKELILIEDTATVDASTQLYFTIKTCKNPDHCPSQVKIVTLFGQFRAPFTPQTTVQELKKYVERTMRIPVEQQRYKFRDQILKDDETLSTREVTDGSEIRLDPKTKKQ